MSQACRTVVCDLFVCGDLSISCKLPFCRSAYKIDPHFQVLKPMEQITMAFRCIYVTLLAIAFSVTGVSAQNLSDVEQGKRLFEGMCARCHGYDGVGGEGPNLNKPNLTRA